MHFDHIGLVADDLEAARLFLAQTLQIDHWTVITEDSHLGVSVQFGASADGPVIELIAPLGPASPVTGALRANKNILNHLAYRVPDLTAAAQLLRDQGCHPTAEPRPALAYGGASIQFWISPLRFLIELIEAPDHIHRFEENNP